MNGEHPKRKKDHDNPYHIYKKDGHIYIDFKDGQAEHHHIEISQELYEAFNQFELDDIRYLNAYSRHIEHSELSEQTLYQRATYKPDGVEDTLFQKLQEEKLHQAIKTLPEKQRRRLVLHYFEQLTYAQISALEDCTTRAVQYSI